MAVRFPLECNMLSENQPARKQEHFNVYCPAEMARAVEERAAAELISASAWIRRVILDRLRAEGLLDEPAA